MGFNKHKVAQMGLFGIKKESPGYAEGSRGFRRIQFFWGI